MPGIQEISQENWDAIKGHILLPYRFENGDLEWIPGKGPEDFLVDKDSVIDQEAPKDGSTEPTGDVEVDNPLKACNAKKAKEFVAETFDVELLKKWQETETRDSVLKAIADQLKKMEPTKEELEAPQDTVRPQYE